MKEEKESINYFFKNKENIATRKSSEIVLEFMNKYNLNLLGGSADLTGSNNTFVKSMHKQKLTLKVTIFIGELESIVWQQL